MEIFSLDIQEDRDILAARDRARVICDELGFAVTQQLQVTTSVFELGKNILEHGKGGKIIFSISTEDDTIFLEVIGQDNGPGLTQDEVHELLINGSSTSTANRGVPAMKRLMDSLDIDSAPGHGTSIRMVKKRPISSSKTIAGNIVSFLQQKFSTRKTPPFRRSCVCRIRICAVAFPFEEKMKNWSGSIRNSDLKLKLEQSIWIYRNEQQNCRMHCFLWAIAQRSLNHKIGAFPPFSSRCPKAW